MEHQQIKAFAPELWANLCRRIREEGELLNAPVRLIVSTADRPDIQITNADTGAWINLKFDPHTPLVRYQTLGGNGYYGFKGDEDGNGGEFLKFLDPKSGIVLFVDELVVQILKHVT